MSLYIHKSNQEILWNTIHKTKLIECIHNNDHNNHKTEYWFRSIIEIFHKKYPSVIDLEMLKKINHETIQYMIDDLKSLKIEMSNVSYLQNNKTNFQLFSKDNDNIKYLSKDEEKYKNQEQYNIAFEEKQKEYQLLNIKPPLPEVSFAEKLDNEPIENINELIEKQMKEREEEINNIFPAIPPLE